MFEAYKLHILSDFIVIHSFISILQVALFIVVRVLVSLNNQLHLPLTALVVEITCQVDIRAIRSFLNLIFS